MQFESALILRSQNDPNASGVISSVMFGQKHPDILLSDNRFEVSNPETYTLDGDLGEMFSFTVSSGFGINVFSSEMMNLVSRLNDGPMRDIMGGSTDFVGYGHDQDGTERRALWPDTLSQNR
jgi:hypothetical protein